MRPLFGEPVSGDATLVQTLSDGLLIGVVDVLGHGPPANELAVRIAAFLDQADGDPATIMQELHDHIRGSRGAAVGLCRVAEETGTIDYVGHGNTVARRLWRKPQRLVSRDGTVGRHIGSPRHQRLRLEPGDVMVFYTDGVKDTFELQEYPQAIRDDAWTIARNVVERFGNDLDDAGCIALTYRA